MDDPLLTFGRIAAAVQGLSGSSGPAIWSAVQPWVTALLANGGQKWLPFLQMEAPCQLPALDPHGHPVACSHPAVGLCIVCHSRTCLLHSFADAGGNLVCGRCVTVARERARVNPPPPPPPPPPREAAPPPPQQGMTRAQALRLLELDGTASDDEIKAAYKRLARKHHPDRQKDPARRADAERRMKILNQAYETLTRV